MSDTGYLTVDQIRLERDALQDLIYSAICEFQSKTRATVNQVYLNTADFSSIAKKGETVLLGVEVHVSI